MRKLQQKYRTPPNRAVIHDCYWPILGKLLFCFSFFLFPISWDWRHENVLKSNGFAFCEASKIESPSSSLLINLEISCNNGHDIGYVDFDPPALHSRNFEEFGFPVFDAVDHNSLAIVKWRCACNERVSKVAGGFWIRRWWTMTFVACRPAPEAL